jgi:2-oxoglutarate ferredoxin oxidoreductase subunit gamma
MVSEKPIGSPVITDDATAAIIMNLPSLAKFEKDVEPGGRLLINSSLIEKKATRDDLQVYYIPANELAVELGNSRVSNMVMLGAYLELTKIVSIESVMKALKKIFGPAKEHLMPVNEDALRKGAAAVRQ